MDTDQRRPCADLEIGDVVTIDVKGLVSACQEFQHDLQYFCGACSNIGWWRPGSSRSAILHMLGQRVQYLRQHALVLAPPMNSVGFSIASASALENGGQLSLTW